MTMTTQPCSMAALGKPPVFRRVVGAVSGGLDFSNYFVPLSKSVTATALADAKKQGAVLAWGNFVTIVINFLIIAWVLFLVVRGLNRWIAKEAEKPATLAEASR